MSKPGLIGTAISQPITVAVGTLLAVFAGILAVTIVPIRMTPEVSSVVVSVTTNWESASAEEVESDIIEEQEKVLGEVTGLLSLTSTSANGQGSIRLEFETGTDIEKANAAVLQKLDEVPGYPNGVLQPKVEPVDIESVDYIAWIGLSSSDPNFPAETLHDLKEAALGILVLPQAKLQLRHRLAHPPAPGVEPKELLVAGQRLLYLPLLKLAHGLLLKLVSIDRHCVVLAALVAGR